MAGAMRVSPERMASMARSAALSAWFMSRENSSRLSAGASEAGLPSFLKRARTTAPGSWPMARMTFSSFSISPRSRVSWVRVRSTVSGFVLLSSTSGSSTTK